MAAIRDVSYVYIKLETVYNTDPGPVAASDCFLALSWDPQPAIYDIERRNLQRPFRGATQSTKSGGRQQHPLKFELSGSGAALTPTAWGLVLLRGCGFLAPSVGASKVTYSLATADDGASFTLHGRKQSRRYRSTGMRSNVKFMFQTGKNPYIELPDAMGLLDNLPDNSAPGTPALPTYPAPVPVNSTNTTVALDGFAVLLRELEIDVGLKVVYRELVGQRAVVFDKAEDGDGNAAKFRILFESPDPSVRSFDAIVAANAGVALSIVHGITAGNIIQLSSAVAVPETIAESTEQGRRMTTITGYLIPSAGGNEILLETL